MKDTTGRDIMIGDKIIYCQVGYRAAKLYFGIVDRMNEVTNKLWIFHTEADWTPLQKMVYDGSRGGYQPDEFEDVGISLVNYSDADRFYIVS